MTPAKTKNVIDTQVPIILKSQWKELFNSTQNFPSQSTGTSTTKLYITFPTNKISIPTIFMVKKLKFEYSFSGTVSISAGSSNVSANLQNLWGIAIGSGFGSSISIGLGSANARETTTTSLNNIVARCEYPISCIPTSSSASSNVDIVTPYGTLINAINKDGTENLSDIRLTIGIGKYGGISGGVVTLKIYYKEDDF